MFKTFPTFRSATLRPNAWKMSLLTPSLTHPRDIAIVLTASEALGSKQGL